MTSTTTLEAERADRISRLAGLERVATSRSSSTSQPGVTAPSPSGYFDNHPSLNLKEKSTVGSASATGSVGGRTTWASGSDAFDADKMSEDPEDGVSSTSNLSDEGDASLVGFGEGASTLSGPSASSHPGLSRMSSGGGSGSGGGGGGSGGRNSLGSPGGTTANMNRPNPLAAYLQNTSADRQSSIPPTSSPAGSNTPEPVEDARMVDGMTYDPDVVDTTARTPRLATPYSKEGGSG